MSAVDLEKLAAAVFAIGRELDSGHSYGTGRDGDVVLSFDPRVTRTADPQDPWGARLFHLVARGATAEMALEALREVALKALEEMVSRAEETLRDRQRQVDKVRGMLAAQRRGSGT